MKKINSLVVNIIDEAISEDLTLFLTKEASDENLDEMREVFTCILQSCYLFDIFKNIKNYYRELEYQNFNIDDYIDKLNSAIEKKSFFLNEIEFHEAFASLKLQALSSVKDRVTKYILMIDYKSVYSKMAEEVMSVKDDIILNALWVIKQIDVNMHENIAGCDFDKLGKQADALHNNGFLTFTEVAFYAKSKARTRVNYDYIIIKNKERLADVVSKYSGINDFMLLLVVTCSETCLSVPLNKRDVMSAINPSLLLHTILYICFSLQEDRIFNIMDFIRCFAHKNLLTQEYFPKLDKKLLLIDESTQNRFNLNLNLCDLKAARMAIMYMQQFILRITDHRITYATVPGFEAECRMACMQLPYTPFNSPLNILQTTAHASPVVLPMFSRAIRGKGVLASPLQSNQSIKPTRNMQSFASSESRYNQM